ncbi:MAG: PQ-loop repeat-containing protein [Bdellovibrionales bacterium]|jgi:uncharacterized protein with PQ loop repeat|nr:PQ-loop repeat-containing protein [Bdellovibrionales bacterium]MBT3525103.1 PQ-loop repeat-containing protein [Bdellovibrionales bacterium]MBT7669874.1 PQ-loop repeat-containing protein [Bdellovibrionales bacterium]MBT7767268.1 PQ-loop repeat-containing protein [Bdellovibrionales bacterium]
MGNSDNIQLLFIESIGWLGAIFFAVCGIPQAYQSWKLGSSRELSALFLWAWTMGELLMTLYVILKHGFDGPLLLNYVGNLIALVVIIYYKIYPRAIAD